MWDPQLRDNSLEFPAQVDPDPAVLSRTLARAVPVSPSELATQPPGTVVVLRAVVRPGRQGVLRAPLSGAPCVWYRSVVVPGWGFTAVPDIGLSDSPPVLEAGQVSARRRLRPSEEISAAPFLVGDATGATIGVDPRGACVVTDVLAVDEVRSPRRINTRALVREWIVPPDASVFVLGTTSVDGTLRPDGGAVLVSTGTEQQLRDRLAASWSQYSHDAAKNRIRTAERTAAGRKYLRYAIALIVLAFVVFALVLTLT